ncbi:MAG: hypothetical protein M1818_007937 [Claussenomyces sp. TS43310]|nr:MAG: hypothetical protein M1818_007937 [Claussenomyces sp. TS43310]
MLYRKYAESDPLCQSLSASEDVLSNRQFLIPSRNATPIDQDTQIGADDGSIPCEAGDGAEKVTEEDDDAVELDDEADEGPAQQDENDAGGEGGGALELVLAREEEEGTRGPDDDGQADEEEHVAHGEHGAIEEEQQPEDEEEDAAGAEGCADFWKRRQESSMLANLEREEVDGEKGRGGEGIEGPATAGAHGWLQCLGERG